MRLDQFCFSDGEAIRQETCAARCGDIGQARRHRGRPPPGNPKGRARLRQILQALASPYPRVWAAPNPLTLSQMRSVRMVQSHDIVLWPPRGLRWAQPREPRERAENEHQGRNHAATPPNPFLDRYALPAPFSTRMFDFPREFGSNCRDSPAISDTAVEPCGPYVALTSINTSPNDEKLEQ